MSNITSAIAIDNICINRNNWRHICDFVYSPSFNPERVFPDAMIFITGHNAQDFFRQAHPFFEGLPILLIDRWDELTEEFVNTKYREISSKKYDVSKLYMSYWADIINKEVGAWKVAHA